MILKADVRGYHFELFKSDKLISVVSVLLNGERARFRKFATDGLFQHRGYGIKLLKHVTAFAKDEGALELWC